MTTRKRRLHCPTSSAHKEWLAEATEKAIWLMDEHGDYETTHDSVGARVDDESALTWRCAVCNEPPIVTEEPVPETEVERLTRELAEAKAEIARMREPAAPAASPETPKPEPSKPIEVYVVSFAPSYDRCSVGGFEWFHAHGDAMNRLSQLVATCGVDADYRLFTLRFPAGSSLDEVRDFLDGDAAALGLCDPPDPSDCLSVEFAAWKEKQGEIEQGVYPNPAR